MLKAVLSPVLALTLLCTSTLGAVAHADAAEQAKIDELTKAIQDLKAQRTLGGIEFTHENMGNVAGGGFTVAVMSYFAKEWVADEVKGTAGRLLGSIAVGGMVSGGVVAVVAGLAWAILPSPANAAEYSQRFATASGADWILSLDTDNIVVLTHHDPDLATMILDLDAKVKAMQGRP